ncbi:lipocalin-like domain-containing protein [Sphingomonas montanisoli]|uniref:Lipocalin-like domain-containing protein n=1 Tax=Sphingomonas montanisoli TaxID=2606412 RepID=A0A5D9CHF5_9SPHN|nr:lipocalin-like domain-containing protein [Sphingomonas montanisoli]TZG29551.1 lipocalin-like domain-containing protein [Sphingomonas montanisoli]
MTDIERLTGTWKLTACAIRFPDGTIYRPYGTAPIGVILYTPERWMSCHMAFGGEGTIGSSYSSYHGPFTIDEAAKVVTHHVIGAFDPAMANTDQPRAYTFDGNTLVLSAGIEERIVEVTWTRHPDV